MSERVFCRQCRAIMHGGNRLDLCRTCRTFQCKDCNEPAIRKSSSDIRCGTCHMKFVQREGRPKPDRPVNKFQRRSIYRGSPLHPSETAQLLQ
jgi:hypothetical protein